jgi:hypothetical protein
MACRSATARSQGTVVTIFFQSTFMLRKMKPIVLAILGGLSILLLFSCTQPNKNTKAITTVKSVAEPVQQFSLHDLLPNAYGF